MADTYAKKSHVKKNILRNNRSLRNTFPLRVSWSNCFGLFAKQQRNPSAVCWSDWTNSLDSLSTFSVKAYLGQLRSEAFCSYVTDISANDLNIVQGGKVVGTLTLCGAQGGAAYDPKTQEVFVGDYGCGQVDVINAT